MKSIKLAVASCRVNATSPLPHHLLGVGGEYLNRTEYQYEKVSTCVVQLMRDAFSGTGSYVANQYTGRYTEHVNWLGIDLDYKCNGREREMAQIVAGKLENTGRFLTERLGAVFDAA